MNQKLKDAVLNQIMGDLNCGYFESLDELLNFVPKENLFGFLSEDDTIVDEDDIHSLLLKYGQACNVPFPIVPNTHTCVMYDGVEYLLPKDTSNMTEDEIDTLEIVNHLFWS